MTTAKPVPKPWLRYKVDDRETAAIHRILKRLDQIASSGQRSVPELKALADQFTAEHPDLLAAKGAVDWCAKPEQRPLMTFELGLIDDRDYIQQAVQEARSVPTMAHELIEKLCSTHDPYWDAAAALADKVRSGNGQLWRPTMMFFRYGRSKEARSVTITAMKNVDDELESALAHIAFFEITNEQWALEHVFGQIQNWERATPQRDLYVTKVVQARHSIALAFAHQNRFAEAKEQIELIPTHWVWHRRAALEVSGICGTIEDWLVANRLEQRLADWRWYELEGRTLNQIIERLLKKNGAQVAQALLERFVDPMQRVIAECAIGRAARTEDVQTRLGKIGKVSSILRSHEATVHGFDEASYHFARYFTEIGCPPLAKDREMKCRLAQAREVARTIKDAYWRCLAFCAIYAKRFAHANCTQPRS